MALFSKDMKNILRPELAFSLFFALFLFLGLSANLIPLVNVHYSDFGGSFYFESIFSLVLGFSFFLLGAIVGRRNNYISFYPIMISFFLALIFVLRVSTGYSWLLVILAGFAICVALVSAAYFFKSNIEKFIYLAFFLAVLSFIGLYLQGVSILETGSRGGNVFNPIRPFFYIFSLLATAGSTVLFPRMRTASIIISLAFLAVMMGFKVDVLIILIVAFFALVLSSKMNLKVGGVITGGATFIIFFMSTFIASSLYGSWKIPPYLYIFYRPGFTLHVFNELMAYAYPWGFLKGTGLMNPREIDILVSTQVLGYENPVLITSSFFGPMFFDLGLVGIVIGGLFVGLVLGRLYKVTDSTRGIIFYSIALAHTISLIEIGFSVISVPFYLALLVLAAEPPAWIQKTFQREGLS